MADARTMKLYDLERSGNCYKIRLFLSVLGIGYTKVPVNPGAGDTRTPEFLAMNPNGLVPVLMDGTTTLYDSNAILAYLAQKYADETWFPREPLAFSSVIRWLIFDQNEGRYGLARARAINLGMSSRLARMGTLDEARALATVALETLDRQLGLTPWLAGTTQPTVADIACYPYAALIGDAGMSLDPYSGIRRWTQAVERLAGHVPLPQQARA